jgi:uridine phosphorylase
MGGASTGIVLPEAVRSGARRFIRVGSCSTLWNEPKVGESAIVTGAVRLDGASDNWAPPGFPAFADHRVVSALQRAAQVLGLPHYLGIEASTSCFNEGQARPDDNGYLPERLKAQHDELVQRGVLLYSMESATIFVWCLTHGKTPGRLWAGSVNAIYGNRRTKAFGVLGDESAARIALHAVLILDRKYPLSKKQSG